MVVKTTTGRKGTWEDNYDVHVLFLQVNLELEFFQISPIVMMTGFHLYSYRLFHLHPSCKAKLVLQMQAPIHQRKKQSQLSLTVLYRLKQIIYYLPRKRIPAVLTVIKEWKSKFWSFSTNHFRKLSLKQVSIYHLVSSLTRISAWVKIVILIRFKD